MPHYEVGKIFPIQQHNDVGEKTLAILTDVFFDVFLSLYDLDTEEIQCFKNNSISIYLHSEKNVPFIVFDIKDSLSFEITININKIKNEKDAERWLNEEANTITLFLVDASTNIIQAMRYISIPLSFAEKIKDICQDQPDSVTTEQIINQTYLKCTTDDLKKQSILSYHIK